MVSWVWGGCISPGKARQGWAAGAAVPLHVGAVQPLAPSSTWSTATPRRGSPTRPRLNHRQEGPRPLASLRPPAAALTHFQSQGRTKAKRGLPPGDPQRVLGRGQEPWGRLSPRCNRDRRPRRRGEEPARPAPCQHRVQQTQRSGSAGASTAGAGPFCPRLHQDEAWKPLWRQRAACSTAPAPCRGTASSETHPGPSGHAHGSGFKADSGLGCSPSLPGWPRRRARRPRAAPAAPCSSSSCPCPCACLSPCPSCPSYAGRRWAPGRSARGSTEKNVGIGGRRQGGELPRVPPELGRVPTSSGKGARSG